MESEWVKENGLQKAKGINQTTTDRLQQVVGKAIEDGQFGAKLINQIKSVYAELNGEIIDNYRAERIARTETIESINFGQQELYKNEGIEKKEWLQEMDDRTRSYADGDKYDHTPAGIPVAVVGINEPFIVSNEKMMFPGDTSMGASAGNTIMCRCTILPVIEIPD